ncbi:MAG: S-methyl-5-thioribose-1-phosphate isomerase [Gammaproteobacteria bacterium]
MNENTAFITLEWTDEGLLLLDQRKLPQVTEYCLLKTIQEVANAITDMVVRGAPAIGVAAAYGVVLGYREKGSELDLTILREARPTAVNLNWAIDQMEPVLRSANNESELLDLAIKIHQEDVTANRCMGELGVDLLSSNVNVLTHCNAGALATAGYGTALGVIRAGVEQNKINNVYADETRPWMQGARLTAWELLQDGIPVTLLADGAAAWLMKQGKVDWVIVGSDRIAANGDVANKIGTYSLALAAKAHGVKFMVVAPTTTIDLECPTGDQIDIESRSEDEVLEFNGSKIAADGASAWNPVFDVTPADLVTAIVTEKGVIKFPQTPFHFFS